VLNPPARQPQTSLNNLENLFAALDAPSQR